MIKELGMAAIMSTSLNAADISIIDIRDTFESNSMHVKSISLNKSTFLSEKEREHFISTAENMIHMRNTVIEKMFKSIEINFDNWIVTDTKNIISIIEMISKDCNHYVVALNKISKCHKNYKKLSSLEAQLAQIMQNDYNLMMTYKPMIEEAKEAQAFMNSFIPQNEEVLRALA